MAIKYWIKKNYEMDYAQDNWLLLTLEEFEEFLKTEEGKRRKKGIARMPYCEKDEVSFWECGEATALEWIKEDNRHQYLRALPENEKIEVLSIEAMLNAEGEEYGEDCIPDPDEDVVSEVIHKMEIEQLRRALALLNPKERQVIECLFFAGEPKSEREVAVILGVSQFTINERKKGAFAKIKKIFEKN